MSKLVDTQLIFDEIWKLRRSQQMLDDSHNADLVMHGLYLVEKAIEKLPSVHSELKKNSKELENKNGELISRQAAIDAIERNAYRHTYIDQIVDIINDLPSIQPEIIRCKDCKHWFNAPGNDEYNSCEEDALIRHKDFFCANGELRGDSE